MLLSRFFPTKKSMPPLVMETLGMERIWKSHILATPVVRFNVRFLLAIFAYLSVASMEMKYLPKSGYREVNASPEVIMNHELFLHCLRSRQMVLLVMMPKLTSLKMTSFSKASDKSIGLSPFFMTIVHQTPIHLYPLYSTAALGLYQNSLGSV